MRIHHDGLSSDNLDTLPESLESLQGSFNRPPGLEGKADRPIAL